MALEVYSATKPASSRRAWIASGLLLAGAVALAVAMARNPGPAGFLGDRIEPEGWDIAFRVPGAFLQTDPEPQHFESAYRYEAVPRRGISIELTFWRFRTQVDTTPFAICRKVLDTAETWVQVLMGPPRPRAMARVGDRQGLEVHNPEVPMVVRSVVLGNGRAYAVSVRMHGALMDESTYRLFDLVCRSVRFHDGG